MNTRRTTHQPLSILLIVCTAFSLLLSACQTVNASTNTPPAQPTDRPVAPATQATVQTPQSPSSGSGEITLDRSGVAQGQTVETVAALPANAESPWWEAAPQHHRLTLEGYPVTGHSLQPQIFVYPTADLAKFNDAAGQMVTALQALLQTQKPADRLPFLPLYNSLQGMHAQVQYLDFKNGKGVRFLTQFNQAPVQINNTQLIYTFQGLTSDGKYYIAAVLPVTHPELPDTQQVFTQSENELSEYPAYLVKTAAWLDQQPNDSFTPDLARLDALIQSIEVK